MDIADMHVNFRLYAQKMGMQNVRAILPEEIDKFINQSITDKINQLIRENVTITNDRGVTDNSKIGQINALRTLYDVREVNVTIGSPATADAPFTYNSSDRLQGLIKHTHIDAGENNDADSVFGKYMFLVGISINYTTKINNEDIVTDWYPVRVIDSAYLASTLDDEILKNNFKAPIACVYKDDTIELYIDKFASGDTPKIDIKHGSSIISIIPNKLRIDTIKYPAIVKYVKDIPGQSNVDCDLPESMHGDIVKHAVDLYRIAVSGSLYANQEAEQAQQRDGARNNYRNENNQ